MTLEEAIVKSLEDVLGGYSFYAQNSRVIERLARSCKCVENGELDYEKLVTFTAACLRAGMLLGQNCETKDLVH